MKHTFIYFFIDPYPQPATVIVSGSRVNRSGSDNLVFNDSVTQWRIIIDINDDQVSLEDVEEYPLRFSSVSNSRVILGPDTIIRIADNDGNNFFNCKLFSYLNSCFTN